MISPALRNSAFALAAAYFVMGIILYAAPNWASNNFAWRISPFVAMTIGGWSLGTAWACFIVARRYDWAAMLGTVFYIGLFGLFETAVLIVFRARLLLASPLAWLYCVTLVASCVFGILAVAEALRQRPVFARSGPKIGILSIILIVSFVLFVGFLGIYGLVAVKGMRGLNAGIFPEILSPFSLRAFGSFYLVLALGAVSLLFTRGMGNLIGYAYSMYGLIVFITVAAFVFIGQFDFAARPTQLTYIGVYLAVGFATGLYLLRYGTGKSM